MHEMELEVHLNLTSFKVVIVPSVPIHTEPLADPWDQDSIPFVSGNSGGETYPPLRAQWMHS